MMIIGDFRKYITNSLKEIQERGDLLGSRRKAGPVPPTKALQDFPEPSGLAPRQWVAASSRAPGPAVVAGLHIATRIQLERPR